MKKNLAIIIPLLFVNLLHAQPIDYDNLAKEYQDVAIQALASIKPSTKIWVEETAQKHPPGKFDEKWVNGQVAGMTGGNPVDGLFALMIAYQKMMSKEAKAERNTSRSDAAQELKLKENKLDLEKEKIGQMRQEANERYNTSMQAANTQTATGISSSSNQVTNNKLPVKHDSLKQKAVAGGAKQPQKGVNAGESKNAQEASRDHRRVVTDNIQKFLDQIAEMKRSGRF